MPRKLPRLLNGWKTELGIVVMAVVAVLSHKDWISQDDAFYLLVLIGSATGLAAKSAIRKSGLRKQEKW